MSLAAIITLACLARALISSPEVAEVSVSWYSKRSSGSSSSRAWRHDRYDRDVFMEVGLIQTLSIFFSERYNLITIT